MLPSCLWFLHCLAGPHTPSICSLTVRRADAHLSLRKRARKRWKGNWVGGGVGGVRRAPILSPLCNLCILYRILPWQRSAFSTVPHCVLSQKKKQAYKQRWRTTQSETFLEQSESGMSFWGGLINHMSSYISKEGGWWGSVRLSPTSLTDLEHQYLTGANRYDAPATHTHAHTHLPLCVFSCKYVWTTMSHSCELKDAHLWKL